ncbi:MAG TPA: PAS domain S-box protein [Pyrinomonadaceae bacterium]
MSTDAENWQTLRAENAELRAQLEEAEETLRAIRGGEVDALVVGEQVYMLESADAASNRFRGEVLAQVNDVVIAVDNDSRITYLNPAAERRYGVNASEVLGRVLADVLQYRWLRPEDEAAALRALSETGIWCGGNIHVKRDGEEIHVESTVNVLRDGGGAAVGLLAVIRDITGRRRAEESLRESEERLRLTMESVTDYAILTTDTEGHIKSWNVGAERTFGYTEEEITGRHHEILFTPGDRERGVPAEEMRRAREAGRAEDERWHVSRRGVRFYVSGVMSPLRANGVLTGYAKVARDLTERKELEDALRRAHDELEGRVRERTLELAGANASLRAEVRERRAAEERSRSLLRQIVTVQEEERRRVARELHDTLGQQLTALRLSIDFLKSKTDGSAGVGEAAERMQSIFDRLNSDVDFLAWELRPAALDELGLDAALQTFVREWSEHFRIEARYEGLGLGGPRLPPEVETNLYRILQEALQNVHKHAGAAHVSVVLERRDGLAVLVVEDDGCGYDPGEEVAADSNKGMGVVNMRERAALVGGELEIESAPGAGATIFVRVPLAAGGEAGRNA